MIVISRKIMKYYRKKLWSFIVYITTIMSSSSKFTTKVTMISNFNIIVFTKITITDMTCSSIIVSLSVNFSQYHLLRKLKLIINLLYILFKGINKHLCNIIIFTFSCEYYWFLRINGIIKTLNIITKRARSVFLIFTRLRFTYIRET